MDYWPALQTDCLQNSSPPPRTPTVILNRTDLHCPFELHPFYSQTSSSWPTSRRSLIYHPLLSIYCRYPTPSRHPSSFIRRRYCNSITILASRHHRMQTQLRNNPPSSVLHQMETQCKCHQNRSNFILKTLADVFPPTSLSKFRHPLVYLRYIPRSPARLQTSFRTAPASHPSQSHWHFS
jgi:hypothetical protein